MTIIAQGKASIAVCDRCQFKKQYKQLRSDGDKPALFVCEDCWDEKNPWKLKSLEPDAICLKYPRIDTPLVPGDE